jgi:hypothetical protein
MKPAKLLCAALLPLALGGCLEVRQHPAWIDGQYAGKQDNRQSHTRFHDDKLAWSAAINDRINKQNEYNRANP